MTLILGIDEAGRGPVLGPLVIAGVMVKEKDEFKLLRLKVKDSKLLTKKRREYLFDKIKAISEYKIITIDPYEIDDAVDGNNSLNLNWLEAGKSAEIINELKPEVVYLDCPSTNINAYANYVKKLLEDNEIKIISEHKADLRYPVVSAASILAKVTRDREIKKIEKTIKKKTGSGYPSDPLTQEFLKNNYDKNQEIIRKSWASYKDIVKKKGQKKLGEF